MNRLTKRCLLGSSLLIATVGMTRNAPLEPTNEPRYVILIIGDGMGDQQITIARNYLKGAAGRLLLDQMPRAHQHQRRQ